MATPSLTAFPDTLRQLRLLDAAQLAEVREKLLPDLADPPALTQELLRRGWLTPYQHDQLALGKGAGLLLGSYVLLEPLGEGGMGQVFKARHWKMGQVVALKLVRPDRAESETVLRRFRREVQAASQMQHPHVVRAVDAEEVGGTCLLAMEYVDGPDLARLVKERGPLPVRLACDIIRQAALGLQHAHERGIVHRDVKPHNLLLGRDGRVKLLDLGVARVVSTGDASATLTTMGALLGTPDYIAPEQAMDSRTADVRSDLYSLGATFYYLLTGQTPYGGASVTERLVRHQVDPVPDPGALRPEVSAEVAAVVQKLLAKRPHERYQTPAELAAVLGALLSRARAPATEEGTAPAAARGARPAAPAEDAAAIVTWAGLASAETADDPVAPGPFRDRARAPRRRWLPIAAAAVVLLVLVAVLAFVVVNYGGSAEEAPPPERGPAAVAVDAAGDWQDTGVDVFEDERFFVTAAGHWRKGEKRCDAAGLPDEPRDRAVLPAAPLLALLVRVGDDPYPLAVGREAMHAPHAGRLFLRANDLDRAGDSGSLQVTVGGGSHSGRPLPSPGPCLAEAAEAAAADLRRRAEDPAAEREALRHDLLAFRRQYAGAPQVGPAGAALAGLVSRLPSPFDRLRHEDVPAEDLRAASTTADAKAMSRLVAVFGDGRLRHWSAVSAALISPDGKSVASASGQEVILWDRTTGREFRRLRTDCGAVVRPCAFFPDGGRLVVAGDAAAVEVWDLQTGKPTCHIDCKQGGVAWIDVSRDGKRLATAGVDGTIKLWDAGMKAEPKVLKGHTGKVWQVAFAEADRVLVSAGADGSVRLWDLETATARTFVGDKGVVYHAALSPDGKTLAAASTTFLRLWDVEKKTFTDLANGCTGRIAFLDGGKLLAVNYNNGLQFWGVADKKVGRALPSRGISSTHVSFSPDGKAVALGVGTEVRVLDLTKKDAEEVPLAPPRGPALQTAAVSPDGRFLATADAGKGIALRDLATGRIQPPWNDYSASDYYRFGLAFGPEGTALFTRSLEGTAGVVKWRNTETGKVEKTCTPKAACYTVACSPDGKTLACGLTGGKVELFDVATGKSLRTFGAAAGVVQILSFSPDGRTLAVGYTSPSGANPLLFEVATGTEVRLPPLAKAAHGYPAFSPDGRQLALSAPGVAGKLVSATTGKEVRPLPAGGPVAFRPDGKVLAIPNSGTVDLWDVASGKVTESVRVGPPGGSVFPSFSADGRHLVTLNGNGTVYVLRLAPAP